jgi:hypothetical protein
MTAHPATTRAIEGVQDALGTYEPTGPTEWADFMGSIGPMWEEIRGVVAQLGDRLATEFPMDASVAEMWGDMAATLGALAEHGNEIHEAFERAHEPELTRAREPRPGEATFDVQNDD